MRIRYLALSSGCLFLSSCALLHPTSYQDGISFTDGVSEFSGNADTTRARAFAYSRLGAVSECFRQGKLAFLLDSDDQSSSVTYSQVYSNTYTSPGYTSFNGETYRDYSKDTSYTSVDSYPVTDTYPKYETRYQCVSHLKDIAGVETEDLSKELVSPYSKDFRGGLLVKKIEAKEASPGLPLAAGDVILAVNGHRVETYSDLMLNELSGIAAKRATFTVLRHQKKKKMSVPLGDLTPNLLTQNLVQVQLACELRDPDEPLIALCEKKPMPDEKPGPSQAKL